MSMAHTFSSGVAAQPRVPEYHFKSKFRSGSRSKLTALLSPYLSGPWLPSPESIPVQSPFQLFYPEPNLVG